MRIHDDPVSNQESQAEFVMARGTLTMTNGPSAGQRYELLQPKMIMGRHPDCEIVLDAGAVSRQHAQVTVDGAGYFIEDLHSRNGTFVNNQPIQDRKKLQDGDILRICDLAFRFRHDEGSQSATEVRHSTDSSRTIVVDDTEETPSSSKIMTKLEVSDSSRVRLEANPQAKLKAVLEINRNMSRSLSLDDVLPRALDSLFQIFLQADRAFVILRDDEGNLIPKAERFRRPDHDESVRISRTVVNEVMNSKEAILSADAGSDQRFEMSESLADFRIRSVMCAPLLDSEDKVLGVIQVDTLDQRSRFRDDDLEVLVGVAAQAGLAIENAQMHEERLRQEALGRDLEMARRVQQGFLPAAPPTVDGYRFFDFYQPASNVGGDYYDYIELPDKRWATLVADVSGKGISAALITAKLSAEARFFLASDPDPALAVSNLNKAFCRGGWDDRFVTLILTVLEPASGNVTIVNAGHLPPLVRYSGRQVGMPDEVGGLPLGVDDGFQYDSFELQLAPGDYLAMFTDGLSEAMNAASDLYGLEQLQARFGDEVPSDIELGRHILDDVNRHTAGHSQSDDMCLVLMGRRG
jgi:serine phosphatase RsbU (regulator of sigma subunit)/pSer/pThr/pTyr-binding forkhead associated (FHA) protein